jgi:hypothetical protein
MPLLRIRFDENLKSNPIRERFDWKLNHICSQRVLATKLLRQFHKSGPKSWRAKIHLKITKNKKCSRWIWSLGCFMRSGYQLVLASLKFWMAKSSNKESLISPSQILTQTLSQTNKNLHQKRWLPQQPIHIYRYTGQKTKTLLHEAHNLNTPYRGKTAQIFLENQTDLVPSRLCFASMQASQWCHVSSDSSTTRFEAQTDKPGDTRFCALKSTNLLPPMSTRVRPPPSLDAFKTFSHPPHGKSIRVWAYLAWMER